MGRELLSEISRIVDRRVDFLGVLCPKQDRIHAFLHDRLISVARPIDKLDFIKCVSAKRVAR